MKKIGLFFGSDTGNTEEIAKKIQKLIGNDLVTLYDMYDAKKTDFEQFDKIILGLSTWHDGQLQSDWDSFFNDFQSISFTNKTVALFGLGDQFVYCDYFIDGVGILGEVVINNGGKIIGKWPTDGYEHTSSKAEKENYEIAIFDDGLQDNNIEYSSKIVCFNSINWIGNGFTIPAGPLRESIQNLKNYFQILNSAIFIKV